MTGLYLPGEGSVHRLAPQAKIVAAVVFVVAVVATPTIVKYTGKAHI